MNKLALLILIFALILPFGIVTAQEPPIGSSDDNACNKGGAMEGKCDTPWEWTCGYYLARWEKEGGWTSNYAFPNDCQSLLPPRPAPAAQESQLTGSITCSTSSVSYPARFRNLLAPHAHPGYTLTWSTSVDPTSVVILRNGGSPQTLASPGSTSASNGTYSLTVNGVTLATAVCQSST
jgi:hypothetical protein